MKNKLFALILINILVSFGLRAEKIIIVADTSVSQINFAVTELKLALQNENRIIIIQETIDKSASCFILSAKNSELLNLLSKEGANAPELNKNESFSIRITKSDHNKRYWAVGNDLTGTMYAGLELAETIRLYGISGIKEIDCEPFIEKRGLKYNIPLDARTPSYSDAGSAAQHNIKTMWEMDYWKEFIDELARNRYNVISLWNPHPFPHLIKLHDYPLVALNDVKKSTLSIEHLHSNYNTDSKKSVTNKILQNLTTIKEISIDEKIKFWQKVMQYGKNRGIEFYFFTWNVFVWGADGKHGITNDQNNEITFDYYRKCIKKLFVTYPLLAGIGITAGENMKGDKEDWLHKVYAEGMMMAMEDFPERKLRFIHRTHQTGIQDINDKFKDYSGSFDFSFKYAGAHIYGYDDPTVTEESFEALPSHKKAWVELRNDDIFNFRWGDPDHVRRFITKLPGEDKLRGFLMGSDGYVWGREFTSTEPEYPRELEIKKHWYRFMLWGRIGYNPELSDIHFMDVIGNRFPKVSKNNLFAAWQNASKIFPLVTEFHWWRRDLEWQVEGCIRKEHWPKPGNFHTVEDFIDTPVEGGSSMITIPDYVDLSLNNEKITGMTPVEVAEKLHLHASNAIEKLEIISYQPDKTIRRTLGDIKAMALAGHYYAEKIMGAVNLQFYRKIQDEKYKTASINHLSEAAQYWRDYADISANQYEPQILARNSHLDWIDLMDDVLEDIEIAKGNKYLSSETVPGSGVILEAEDASYNNAKERKDMPGFTGEAYLIFRVSEEGMIEWIYNAPEDGKYTLAFRYSTTKEKSLMNLTINDETQIPKLLFWNTSAYTVWKYTRRTVQLKAGNNSIRLYYSENAPLIDHLYIDK